MLLVAIVNLEEFQGNFMLFQFPEVVQDNFRRNMFIVVIPCAVARNRFFELSDTHLFLDVLPVVFLYFKAVSSAEDDGIEADRFAGFKKLPSEIVGEIKI